MAIACRGRKEKPPTLRLGVLGKDPGDDLLSHADAHYHRRVSVSLPSSEWDRVVPLSYCHQGDRGGSPAPDGVIRTRSSAHALKGKGSSELCWSERPRRIAESKAT